MTTDREVVMRKRAEAAAAVEEWSRRVEVYDDLLIELGNGNNTEASSPEERPTHGKRWSVRTMRFSSPGEPKNLVVAVKVVLAAHPDEWMKVGDISSEIVTRFAKYANKDDLGTLVSNALVRSRDRKLSWLEAEKNGKNWRYRFRDSVT